MRFGLTIGQAVGVIVSTVALYLVFLVLIRLVGQRAIANMSSFDFAAAIALGAVMGRAMLGYTPTLLGGVLAVGTLFGLQLSFGVVRRNRRADRLLSNLPLLLMADGAVVETNLHQARMVEDELRQKLRLAGIHRYEDAAAVILERTGAISVLRRGETIAADLVSDVRGRELLAAQNVDRSAAGGQRPAV